MRVQVKKLYVCDFCDRNEDQVPVIIVGLREVAICDNCASEALDAAEERASERRAFLSEQYDELGPVLVNTPVMI